MTPSDRQPSETNFRRAFLAQFSDASAPDLVFRQRYTQLNEAWIKKFGWPIFRPLHEADAHIPKQIRVPISESLSEFENQILFLVKLQIDSLNDAELTKANSGAFPNEKSISKLKRYLDGKEYPYTDRDIDLLRTLQDMRSSGAVHSKGKNFEKNRKKVGLDRDTPREVFRDLLIRVNRMLADLSIYFRLEEE